MPQKLLDGPQVDVVFRQSGGEGVPEGVRRDMLDLRPLGDPFHQLLDMPGVDVGSVPGREDQVFWIRFAASLLTDPPIVEHMADIVPKWNLEMLFAGFCGVLHDEGALFGGIGIKQLNPDDVPANAELFVWLL